MAENTVFFFVKQSSGEEMTSQCIKQSVISYLGTRLLGNITDEPLGLNVKGKLSNEDYADMQEKVFKNTCWCCVAVVVTDDCKQEFENILVAQAL